MLHIKNIHKKYVTGDLIQQALDGVTLAFRDNEFVAILGPSGSGKTTLLNIIGGLDRYDSGDLIINGVSTKKYKDRDWDTYRNHSIGFVFQSYNLISHQTVLANVELALTISGISKSERRRRAKEALEKVGLGNQIHKKPNQMSGGQMQRVAIARALVNNPEILLADEPTGALDTQTGIQVMELLKEVAKDRLVIMVTHNPELAEQYANRIVKLKDGQIISDSNPLIPEDTAAAPARKVRKAAMSFRTALGLSFNNLMTKKARTLMTSAAGSIGIIGIALILALSSGVNKYITDLQKESMASYPINISSTTLDLASMIESRQSMMGKKVGKSKEEKVPSDGVHTNSDALQMMNSITANIVENDLTGFRNYLEDPDSPIHEYIGENGVVYTYDTLFDVYTEDENGNYLNTSRDLTAIPQDTASADPTQETPDSAALIMDGSAENMTGMMNQNMASMNSDGTTSSSSMDPNTVMMQMIGQPTKEKSADNFAPLLPGPSGTLISPVVTRSYDVLAGAWPAKDTEVVLVLDSNNSLTTTVLYQLGLLSQEEYQRISTEIAEGVQEVTESVMDYDQILGHEFRLVTFSDYYSENENGTFQDARSTGELGTVLENGCTLTISGIVRANEDAATTIYAAVAYPAALTDYIIDHSNTSAVVKAQEAAPETDVLTGAAFAGNSYQANLAAFGKVSYDAPSTISIYCDSFEDKDRIADAITDYNKTVDEDSQITYTDYVALLTTSITSMVNIVSYVLIAFVAVSLIVSCIMISIITQISVMERTKEIGILRAIGASKRNISQVFNAETFIIGISSGVIGVAAAVLLTIPINNIIHSLVGDDSVNAVLPWNAAVILILISVVITVFSGLIPSKNAAKKDPVIALRTE